MLKCVHSQLQCHGVQFFTAVTVKIGVFLDVIPRSVVGINGNSWAAHCLLFGIEDMGSAGFLQNVGIF